MNPEKSSENWFTKHVLKGKKLGKEEFVIVVMVGILLLVIGFPTKKIESGISKSGLWDSEEDIMDNTESTKQDELTTQNITMDSYSAIMEEKLEKALSKMEGVGQVEVVITLKSSEEQVIDKEQPIQRESIVENDSEGGSRTVNNTDAEENTIYSKENGNEVPYVIKVINPQVEGVLVIAQGAGSGNVSKNITESIQVLFGIEVHKIRVVKMKNS